MMRKLLIAILFCLFALCVSAQGLLERRTLTINIITASAYGVAPADTFTVNTTILTDPLGGPFNGTQIDTSDIIMDQLGRRFYVETITTQTVDGFVGRVVQMQDDNFIPFGKGVIYKPGIAGQLGTVTPVGDDGITPALQARIMNNNIIKLDSLISAAGGGTTESADGVTILGDGSGGSEFNVDTTLISTVQGLNDSIAAQEHTWLKPELEAGSVTINSSDSLFIVNGTNTSAIFAEKTQYNSSSYEATVDSRGVEGSYLDDDYFLINTVVGPILQLQDGAEIASLRTNILTAPDLIKATMGNYVFDTDQTPTDDYVLRYDAVSGEIRLESESGGGSTEEADLETILGVGTSGDPFTVDTTLIATTQAVIDSIAAGAVTPAEIVTSLETLSGENRLDVSAVKNARGPEYIDILFTGQSNMVGRDEVIGEWTYTTSNRVLAFQFDTDGFEVADPFENNIQPFGSVERNNIAFRVGKNFAKENLADTVRLLGYAENGQPVERWTPATTGLNETADNFMLDSLVNRLDRSPSNYLARVILIQQGESNDDDDNFLGKWEEVYDTLVAHSKIADDAIMIMGRFNPDDTGAHQSIDSLIYGLRNTNGRPIYAVPIEIDTFNTVDNLNFSNEFIDILGDAFYAQSTGPVQLDLNNSYSYKLGRNQTGTNFAAGAGAYNGFENIGDSYSGGAGYELGYQNTGNSFSGGAGYRLGYQNTGESFSGGAGYQLGYQNTGESFSGGAGRDLGYQNSGSRFSGGAGYKLGYANTGSAFSGGVGYELGYQNTAANFSGGVGYRLGYANTGSVFSGGAGYELGYQNTGSAFSGGAGYKLGYQNTGLNFSGGAGLNLGYQNSGSNFSGGAGYQLGYTNNSANFSGGAGYQLGYQNTGMNFSGGAGYQLGYQNTGVSFSGGTGYRIGFQNTGDYFSVGAGQEAGAQNIGDNVSGGGGYKMLYRNRGNDVMGDGYQTLLNNTGNRVVGIGFESGKYNDSDSIVYVGYASGSWEIDTTKQITTTQNQRSGDSITVSSTTTLGAISEYVNLKIDVVGDFTPNVSDPMMFLIVDGTTITATHATLAGSATTDTLTITPVKKYNNSVAIGYEPIIDGRDQIVLGNSNNTELKAGKIRIDVSQTLTGSEEDYVLKYNHGTGQFSAEAQTDDQTASEVQAAVIGSPTFSTVQHMQDIFHSSGHVSGAAITESGGGTTFDVAAGTGLIRATDNELDTLYYFDFAASAGNAIAVNETKYVGVTYNAGSPQVVVKTTNTWNHKTDYPLGTVVRDAGGQHVVNIPHAVGDHASLMIQRLYGTMPIVRDQKVGGILITELGTRNVQVSAGRLWSKLSPFDITDVNTSVAGTFDSYYQDGASGWTSISGVTQWDNANFDNGTGTLAALPNNHYTNRWFYMELDGNLVMVYGQASYPGITGANEESPPMPIPDRLSEHGILIGRLVVQEGNATAESVESAWTTSFSTIPAVAGTTNLAFTGATSPITLTSDTGTDVAFAAGTGISLAQAAGTTTISADGANIYNTNGTQDDATRTWNIDGNDLYLTNAGTLYLGADNAAFTDYISIADAGATMNFTGTNTLASFTVDAFGDGAIQTLAENTLNNTRVAWWVDDDVSATQQGIRAHYEESATAADDISLFFGDHFSNNGLWVTKGDAGANISTHTAYFTVDIGNNEIQVGKSDTEVVIQGTIWLDSGKTVGIFHGTGSPESVVTGAIGSTFHRTDGGASTTLYVKESGAGNTGWVAK